MQNNAQLTDGKMIVEDEERKAGVSGMWGGAESIMSKIAGEVENGTFPNME